MPGKSRHGKHKLPRSKRGKGRQDVSSASTQQVVAQAYKPVSRPEVSAPSVSVPTTGVTLAATRHPDVAAELRRIGILAGVVLVILVILALVLS